MPGSTLIQIVLPHHWIKLSSHRPPPRMGRPSSSREPALPVPRHLCGSRRTWSLPSPGPRPSGQSRAGLQCTQHRHQSLCARATADPDCHAVDLDLDRFRHWPRLRYPAPSVAQQETIPHPQLPARTAARHPQNVQPQIPAIVVASQTTAAAIIHGVERRTDRVSARRDLGDNPGLVFIAPCPAPVNTSSRRTGSVIAVCTVSILSRTVKTRPQTRRSGHHPEGGPRISITEHFGDMGIVSLKGDWL
jgi:hypothetical protein